MSTLVSKNNLCFTENKISNIKTLTTVEIWIKMQLKI